MEAQGQASRGARELPREVAGFRLLRVLGKGGMGIVYEAEELASGRRVALKVLADELSVSEEAFERFRREARIAASVSDTSCVFVFGAHQVEGSPAIAMELCVGETLDHRIQTGDRVPVADAVRWTMQILDGLEAAHQAGVIHRDVKPSNCFLTAEGRIKVGDFGLARSLERDVQLTRSGVFLGSPLYAAPEQVRGRQVDLRSDLYSVGATLYAVLTGRSPYHGENLGEVLARILSEAPEPPSALRADVSRGLDRVILRAMSREPDQRFQSHAAMRAALAPYAESSREAASRRRRFFAHIADLGVLALLQLPIIGIWTHFDPKAIQPLANQPWRLQSIPLVLTLGGLGFAYYAVSEGLFRRTIGKWVTGQRVALVGDRAYGAWRRVFRALCWTAPSVGSVLIGLTLNESTPNGLRVALGLGLVPITANLAMLSTMRRRNGWRGVHEFLSGTRVLAEPLPFARFARQKAPPPARLEPSDRLPRNFGAYATVGRVGRTPTGEIFEASDTSLDRRVWIHVHDGAATGLLSKRRALEHPTRLRWLDGFEADGRRHEVFEAPGGARLVDCCDGTNRLPWPVTHGVLASLAEVVDGEPAPELCLEQLWLDRSWQLRILDEPVGERTSGAREPLEILSVAARASLGREADAGPDPTGALPQDLPEHAEGVARRLLGLDPPFASVAEARRSLAESAQRPQGLSRKIRSLQLLLGSGLWMMLSAFLVAANQLIAVPQARDMIESASVLPELRSNRAWTAEDVHGDGKVPTGPELDAEGVRERSLVAADLRTRFRQFGQGTTLRLDAEEREQLENIQDSFTGRPTEEIAAARAHLRSTRPAGSSFEDHPALRQLSRAAFFMPAICALVWALFSILFAFLFRGGLSLRIVSLALRNRRGQRASRLRCTGRAVLVALPFVAIYAPSFFFAVKSGTQASVIALVAGAVAHAFLFAAALRDPARGWQDRLAGTRIVPR